MLQLFPGAGKHEAESKTPAEHRVANPPPHPSPSLPGVSILRAQACLSLSSRYRWCLTGTPLQNKPEDMGSIFSFLRLVPASNSVVFTRAIGKPIRAGDVAGLARLRVLMKSVCLRRLKATLGDKLPPKVQALLLYSRSFILFYFVCLFLGVFIVSLFLLRLCDHRTQHAAAFSELIISYFERSSRGLTTSSPKQVACFTDLYSFLI